MCAKAGSVSGSALFYFFEKTSPHVVFRVRVFRGEHEGGFSHDEVLGDRTEITGITGVEYFVATNEVPVFAEGVLPDEGIAKIDSPPADTDRLPGFV